MYLIIIKKPIHQESITIWITKHLITKHQLHEAKTDRINGDIDKFTITGVDFNSLFSIIDQTIRQNINKHIEI